MAATPDQPETSPDDGDAKPRSGGRRRRILPRNRVGRWLLLIFLLLIVAAVVTQIVLSTNVPRDLVLTQLQKQLGLRVEAASLTTGWLGNTHLRDVTISLPLSADDALVRVPRMRVKHNSLLGLAWSRSVTIDTIELEKPHLVVRQDDAGRWNLQQVAGLLARTGGKESADAKNTSSSRPELPSIRVTDATVDVIDRSGQQVTVTPVNVTGDPIDALTWQYDVTAGPVGKNPAPYTRPTSGPSGTPQLSLVGRVAVGGSWSHEVRITALNVERWATPWTKGSTPPVGMTGEWQGQLNQGGIGGRLVVDALDIGTNHAAGTVSLATEAGSVVAVRPENLLVVTGKTVMPEVRVTGGRVALDGKSTTIEGLNVVTFNGVARVDARCDWASGSADLSATWSDFAIPGQRLTHDGSLTASVRHPFPDQPVVDVHLLSNGNLPWGQWHADVKLGGTGTSWSNVDWQLRFDTLKLDGPRPVTLDGFAADIHTRGSVVSLASLKGPGDVVARGNGQYDLSKKDWRLRLDLSNLPRPLGIGGRTDPVAFTFNAHGSAERVAFEQPGISLRTGEAELRADGDYVFNRPKPLEGNLYFTHVPPREVTDDGGPLYGTLMGNARLVGTVLPMNLDVTGHLDGDGVRILDRELGNIDAELSGRVDDQRLTLRTSKLNFLGGQWQFDALFPDQGMLGVNLNVEGLPMAALGEAVNRPNLDGKIDARFALLVSEPNLDGLSGTATIKGHGLKADRFAADLLDATIVLADGTLIAEPVRLRKGEGQANLHAEMDIHEIRRFDTRLELAGWPLELSDGTRAELWGGTTGLRITLPGATRAEGVRRGMFRPETKAERVWIVGPIDVRASLTLKDQPMGDAHLLADVRGRRVDLTSVSFDGLDGTVQGQGLIDFDRLMEMRIGLYFEEFNAARIPEFFPENEVLVGLHGRFSGQANIAPAPKATTGGAEPLAPLRIQAKVKSEGGRYRSVAIGPIQFSAFTDLDRFVIQDSPTNPTTIELAGGLVRVWGRLTALQPGRELNTLTGDSTLLLSQTQVTFKGIDLDQIVHAFKPDAERMPGRLDGSFEAIAGTRPHRQPGQARSGMGIVEKVVRRINADGRVSIYESDLVNFDVVGGLYNRIGVAFGGARKPDGTGNLRFHMEDGKLALSNVRYFNRGTEIRALANIDEVWKLPQSPLSGTAVGTQKAFKDIKLPIFSLQGIDTVLTVLQTDLTTVSLKGTLANPEIGSLAFTDIGKGMRDFILGDFASVRTSGDGAK